ncbi:hypothetical protein ACHAXA_004052 [Cyclostephanos tholiformis]|uniref:Uncharacterized protein n=1 Tax=Cyclostephanos tholiformis TaxID=382380 RepID=A0ABD3R629_9STRA
MNLSCCKSSLPGLVASFAFILALFGGCYCQFLSFASSEGGEDAITLNFGIWYYQGWEVVESVTQGTVLLKTCNHYPDGTVFDSKWKSAKAFSTMALVMGGVMTFWALLAGLIPSSKAMFRMGGSVYMVCCLFTGLSLLLLDSNACNINTYSAELNEDSITIASFPETCTMGPGAKCTIAATVLWFAAAIAACMTEPRQRRPITTETHDVTYTKTTGPDGTTILSEAVVKGAPVPTGGLEIPEQAV